MGTADECEKLISVANTAGNVDILINNSGIFEPKPFVEITDADWLRFYEINVMSGVRLSRAVCQSMSERGWGRIVFISSESAINIPVEMIQYGMTKSDLHLQRDRACTSTAQPVQDYRQTRSYGGHAGLRFPRSARRVSKRHV